jgi:4-hydroxybenzoate polyprenyltransferase
VGQDKAPAMIVADRNLDPGWQCLPVCVDLDGTLIASDLLFEGIARLLKTAPWRLPMLLFWIVGSRAQLKAEVAKNASVDPRDLPYRRELLDYLREQKRLGRQLYIATAADHRDAERVVEHLDIFDGVIASNGTHNLKGAHKAEILASRFPEGFVYAGDSVADLHVWRHAKAAITVGCSPSLLARLNIPVEKSFQNQPLKLKTLIDAARVHHWLKNVLIFLPLFLGRDFTSPHKILLCMAGFLTFSVMASASYMANDIVDLTSDRQHQVKRFRPFASGTVPLIWGLLAVPLLYLGGIIVAYRLNPAFCVTVLCYILVTTLYSAVLKSRAMLDVICLGVLFTLRIYMGVVLLDQALSPWLLMFSLSFFCGLSFIKRAAELLNSGVEKTSRLPGRGYCPEDTNFITIFGIATAMLSVVIFILYIANDRYPRGLYAHPEWLWLVPLPLFYWNGHMWFETLRRKMNEDPVSYAIKDPASWFAFAIMLSAVLLAY